MAQSSSGVAQSSSGVAQSPSGVAQSSSFAIPALACLLEHLLPPPGKAVEPRVPAGLRYTLIRARGGVTAPPFQSLQEFSESLERFEHGDRKALLAALFGRTALEAQAHRKEQTAPPTKQAPVTAKPAAAPATQVRVVPPAPSGQAPVVRWDELSLRPEKAAPGSDAAGYRAPRGGREGRDTVRSAGPLLTAAAAVSMIVAAAVVAAAVVVSVNEPVKPPILQTIGPQLDRLREAVMAATGVRREDPQETGAKTDAPAAEAAASNAPVDFPPVDFPPSGPQPTRGTAGANDAPSDNAVLPPTPGAEASRPGDMIEALDVSSRPVFSPSFAVDGSAIFFDQDNAAGGSALKEARTEGTGRVLHVLSVLDDGARNYHPRLSPDGSQVAFDSDRDGVRGIYLSDRSGHNIRRVSGEGYAAVPAWSPDGTRLAYIKAEPQNSRVWNIWTLDVGAGVATRLTSYRVGQPWGASWFPDNQRICYTHEDRLIVLDTATNQSRTYLSPRKGVLVRTPAVSPDGARVIFQLYRDGGWLLDLSDGTMSKVLDDPTAEEFAWSPDGARVAFHSRRDRQWGIWVIKQR